MARLGTNSATRPEVLVYVARTGATAAVSKRGGRRGSLEKHLRRGNPDLLVIEESFVFDGDLLEQADHRDILRVEDHAARDALEVAKEVFREVDQSLEGLRLLRDLIPCRFQDFHDGGRGTAISRALEKRAGSLPVHPKRSGLDGPRPYLLEAGVYRNAVEVDFRSFYPSIIVNESITPHWDQAGAFRQLAEELRDLLVAFPKGIANEQAKNLAVAMSGMLNAGLPGSEPDRLVEIYRHGDRLLRRLVSCVEAAKGTVIWHQTDGLLARDVRAGADLRRALEEALPNYPVKVDYDLDILLTRDWNRIIRSGRTIKWKGKWAKRVRRLPGADDLIHALLDEDLTSAASTWRRLTETQRAAWAGELTPLGFLVMRDLVKVFGKRQADSIARSYERWRDGDWLEGIRHQNQEGRRRRRLSVLGAPCAKRIGSALPGGDLEPKALLKAVAELRIGGLTQEEVAKRLVKGDAAALRYGASRGIFDGPAESPRVSDAHWSRGPDDQQAPSCRHAALHGFCQPHKCYRSRRPSTFSDRGPSFDEYLPEVRAQTARAVRPSEARFRPVLVEAPCRGGKTFQLVRVVLGTPSSGQVVWVVAPDHRAADAVMQEMGRLPRRGPDSPLNGKLTVHRIGRGRGSRVDLRVCRNPTAESCGKCARNTVGIRLDRRKGLYDLDRLNKTVDKLEADGNLTCARSLSYELTRHAHVVVMTTEAYVRALDPDRRGRASSLPDLICVDEADRFSTSLHIASQRTFQLAGARASPSDFYGDGGRRCNADRCAECHDQFAGVPGERERGGLPVLRKQVAASTNISSGTEFLLGVMAHLVAHFEGHPDATTSVLADAVLVTLDLVGGLVDLLDQASSGSPRARLQMLRHRNSEPGECGWVWRDTQAAWTWTLPRLQMDYPEDLDALCERGPEDQRVAFQLVRFVTQAVRCSSEIMLLPRIKSSKYQTWLPGCGLELGFVDERKLEALLGHLRRKPSLMVSGTQGRPAVAAGRLGLAPSSIDFATADVGMHTEYTLFVSPPAGLSKKMASLVDLASIQKLGDWLDSLAAERPHTRVLIFAKTKERARATYDHLRQRHRAALLAGHDVIKPRSDAGGGSGAGQGLAVHVDYLRSGDSRAVDRDYDLVVVHGTGLPSFNGLALTSRWMERKTGIGLRPDELARDDAARTIVQALLRNAGRKNAVGLLVGDHLPEELTEYLAPRTVWLPNVQLSSDPNRGLVGLVVRALDGRRLPDSVPRVSLRGAVRATGLPLLSSVGRLLGIRRRDVNTGQLRSLFPQLDTAGVTRLLQALRASGR